MAIDVMGLLRDPIFQMGVGIMGSRGGFNQAVSRGMQTGLDRLEQLQDMDVQKSQDERRSKEVEQIQKIREMQEQRAQEEAKRRQEKYEYEKSQRPAAEAAADLQQKIAAERLLKMEADREPDPFRKKKMEAEIRKIEAQIIKEKAQAEYYSQGGTKSGAKKGAISVDKPVQRIQRAEEFLNQHGDIELPGTGINIPFVGEMFGDSIGKFQLNSVAEGLQAQAKNANIHLPYEQALQQAYVSLGGQLKASYLAQGQPAVGATPGIAGQQGATTPSGFDRSLFSVGIAK